MSTQAERLSQDFEITPQKGIELEPLPQKEETVSGVSEEEQPEQEIEATEEATEETAESQTEEPETEVEEQSDEGLNMSIGQFANAAGVTLRDMYGIRMPDGRTLSQAVDEGKEQQATLGRLQTENSQLKEQLSKAQTSFVPMDDPEALALEKEAEVYQKALDNADWSQVDPGVAANQKLEYRDVIDKLRRAAQGKREENAVKQRDAHRQALMVANQELLKHIPEWNSAEIYARDNRAMGDFLTSEGFTNEDLSIFDTYPVAKKFMYKAWKAMAKQKEIERGAKKVRKISKSLSPGGVGKSTKTSLKEAGKAIRQGKTATERSRARLSVEFDR